MTWLQDIQEPPPIAANLRWIRNSLCSLEVRGSCHRVACAAANFTRGVALLQADGIRSPAHQRWFQSSRTVGGYTINIPWIVTVNPFWSARGQSGFDVLDDAVALPGIPDSKGCGGRASIAGSVMLIWIQTGLERGSRYTSINTWILQMPLWVKKPYWATGTTLGVQGSNVSIWKACTGPGYAWQFVNTWQCACKYIQKAAPTIQIRREAVQKHSTNKDCMTPPSPHSQIPGALVVVVVVVVKLQLIW